MSAKKSWKPLTPEERAARHDAAMTLMQEGVTKILESDGYRAALTAARRFHTYSFNNIVMIVSQRKNATRVAGYQTWRALGRHVKSGERAIKIWVPMTGRKRDATSSSEEAAADSGDAKQRSFIRFTLGNVFDIEQTDGPDLPNFPEPKVLDADSFEVSLFTTAAVKYAASINFPITMTDAEVGRYPGAHGFCQFDPQRIIVRASNPPLQRLKTSIHEIAHAIAHAPASVSSVDALLAISGKDEQQETARRELEAESTAFLVCSALGLDTEEYSFPYLASWADSRDLLVKTGHRSCQIARDIGAALDRYVQHELDERELIAQGAAPVDAARMLADLERADLAVSPTRVRPVDADVEQLEQTELLGGEMLVARSLRTSMDPAGM